MKGLIQIIVKFFTEEIFMHVSIIHQMQTSFSGAQFILVHQIANNKCPLKSVEEDKVNEVLKICVKLIISPDVKPNLK